MTTYNAAKFATVIALRWNLSSVLAEIKGLMLNAFSLKLDSSWGLRIFLKSGTLHRFAGFKDTDKEKIAKYFSNTYKIDMLEKELSLRGWNWGTAKFYGSVY
ncbi:Ssrp [Trypoxylus dichotomus]